MAFGLRLLLLLLDAAIRRRLGIFWRVGLWILGHGWIGVAFLPSWAAAESSGVGRVQQTLWDAAVRRRNAQAQRSSMAKVVPSCPLEDARTCPPWARTISRTM